MPTKLTIAGKKQLTERISRKTKYPQNQVSKIIDEFLEETKKALVKGEEVRLQGYFSLKTTMTKPRIAMNLQTKKKMKVPSKRVPKCKFSLGFKEEIARKKIMTLKEEVEQLRKEVKDLKKELREQNNKWNKIYTVASVVSALIALMNLIIAWLNYRK